MTTAPSVGLALSGGGSRAIAFHLGCLRALHDRDILPRVRVVSGISGGAVLTAMWAYGHSSFAEFDATVVDLLRGGLQRSILRHALAPSSLVRSVGTNVAVLARSRQRLTPESPLRTHSLTEAFAQVLRDAGLATKLMTDHTKPDLDVVLTATDLRSGGAVRFGSRVTAASRLGRIVDRIPVADAVAASAAYPLLLPALERAYTFDRRGERRRDVVLLGDGGIYDNLGLSVFEPGRSPEYTEHVYPVDYVISCDAGRSDASPTPRFRLSRTARSFDLVHRRAQDHGRGRLHEWGRSGSLRGFLMAYLAMRDANLPVPVADLIPREAVASYRTNFAPMSAEMLTLLTIRGEQLTRTLLPYHCPGLA